MTDSGNGKKPEPITRNRIILWILVGGFGLYLVISGAVGLINS